MTLEAIKMKVDASQARACVSALSDAEMHDYAQSSEQFLFADEVCSRFNFETTPRNVDAFEIALDDRATEMGIF